MLILDSDHSYWRNGQRKRGVTEIIDAAGLIPRFSKNSQLAERGRIVHKACQLLALGKLDWNSVDERLWGFVRSYERLLEHTGWLANAVEVTKYSELWDFCGTFDINFVQRWLCDLKTGGPVPWHRAQLGAYWHLNGQLDRCASIYLQEDGSIARLKEVNGRDGWIEFLGCLREARNGSTTD